MMKLFNYGIGCSAMLLAAILSGCSSDEPLVQKSGSGKGRDSLYRGFAQFSFRRYSRS